MFEMKNSLETLVLLGALYTQRINKGNYIGAVLIIPYYIGAFKCAKGYRGQICIGPKLQATSQTAFMI